MKKLASLMFAGMVFCTTAVVAQAQDTIPAKKEQSNQLTMGKDWTAVSVSDVPASLRQTLQATEYKGWDQPTSVIYRNSVTNYYQVEIHDGKKTNTYRFDKDGKPIKD